MNLYWCYRNKMGSREEDRRPGDDDDDINDNDNDNDNDKDPETGGSGTGTGSTEDAPGPGLETGNLGENCNIQCKPFYNL